MNLTVPDVCRKHPEFFIVDAIYTIPTVAVDIYVFDMPSTTVVGDTVRNIRVSGVIQLFP